MTNKRGLWSVVIGLGFALLAMLTTRALSTAAASLEPPASINGQVRAPQSVSFSLAVNETVISGAMSGGATWGDYDNDGDLDVLVAGFVTGGKATRLYRNDGGGVFADSGAALPAIAGGSVAWGDYDGDGDLDILITGSDASFNPLTKLYRNDGGGVFVDSGVSSLIAVYNSHATWGDYNNDGRLDVLIIGYSSSTSTYNAKLYRNDGPAAGGGWTFTDSGVTSLAGVSQGSAAWGDYDKDGDLDLLIIGADATSAKTARVYRNDGPSTGSGWTFTNIGLALTGVSGGSVTWADYDSDGDLDFLVTGVNASIAATTYLYRNDGNGVFTSVTSGLPSLQNSNAAWGDYDNDGDLDVFLCGMDTSSAAQAWLYTNNGGGSFANSGFTFLAASACGVGWGDYDNDGDLDLVLAGQNGLARIGRIYRNDNTTANTAPTAPGGLSQTITNDTLIFAWNAASDSQTSAGALTYNLYVTPTGGLTYTVPPMANQSSGLRRIAAMGNAQQGLTATYNFNLTPGNYAWSVQAIDHAYAGGPWATAGSFAVTAAPNLQLVKSVNNATPLVGSRVAFTIVVANLGTASATGAVISDALPAGLPLAGAITLNPPGAGTVGTPPTLVSNLTLAAGASVTVTFPVTVAAVGQINNIAGVTCTEVPIVRSGSAGLTVAPFTLVVSETTVLSRTADGQVTWGDYDNDGDLDLLVVGSTTTSNRTTKVYRNQGNGSFVDSGINNLITLSYNPRAAWGDYDNDGYLDILMSGYTGSAYTAKIYRNNGNGTFTDSGISNLAGAGYGSAAWGDYDNDGDLDILLTGSNNGMGTGALTRLYRNNGDGTFTSVSTALSNVFFGSAAWGDYDNDGNLDILITGSDTTGAGMSKVYRNQGDGTFSAAAVTLPAVSSSVGRWGDYDADGDLDILLAGYSGGNKIVSIYRNNGNGTFTDSGVTNLIGVNYSSAEWGDYDNDGDLDILVSGQDASNTAMTKLYQNTGGSFSAVAGSAFTGVSYGSVAWGDYDNDGDLDLALSGQDYNYNYYTRIYRNDNTIANTAPAAPTGLIQSEVDGRVTFTWTVPTDDHTPLAGLSYNLYVTPTNKMTYTLSPMANQTSGYRRIVGLGNAQHGVTATLNVPPGDFVWSVQAIDGAYAGSAWAMPGSFSMRLKPLLQLSKSVNDATPGLGAVVTYTIVAVNAGTGDATGAILSDTLPASMTLAGSITLNPAGAGVIGAPPTLVSGLTITAGTRVTVTVPVAIDLNARNGVTIANTAAVTSAEVSAWVAASADLVPSPFVLKADESALTGLIGSAAAWGDYDNDGNLDLLMTGRNITGNQVTNLYRNQGNGVFANSGITNLIGVENGSLDWGDFDNDGDLDILLTGYNSSTNRVTKIYSNNGNGSFTLVNAYDFPDSVYKGLLGVDAGNAEWGDYDNDGDLDIVLTGSSGPYDAVTQIYRNDGPGLDPGYWFFATVSATLPGVSSGNATWGDYDNDGDLDLLVAGTLAGASGVGVAQVYRNDNGAFVTTTFAISGTTLYDNAVWGDYDSDGDLDILISGRNANYTRMLKIFRNDANGVFVDTNNTSLARVEGGSAEWGDYDNDGDLDLLLTGTSNSGADIAWVERNDGGGNFSVGYSAPGLMSGGDAAWGDYDNDGDLDFAMTGQSGSSNLARIYRNNAIAVNRAPAAPVGLSMTRNAARATFFWSAATDDHTSEAGLSYNLYIRPAAGITQAFPAMANLSSGYRRIPAAGRVGHTFSHTLDVPSGDYWWSAQAIDGALAGGAWALESYLSIPYLEMVKSAGNAAPNPGEVVTYTITLVNSSSTTNIANGVISDTLPAGLSFAGPALVTPPTAGTVGTPPALVTGLALAAGQSMTVTYRVTVTGVTGQVIRNTAVLTSPGSQPISATFTLAVTPFTLAISETTLTGVSGGNAAWGDYDNDGDLDILAVGSNGAQYDTRIYRNDGGAFVYDSATNFASTNLPGKADWGDYDNDGYLDILMDGIHRNQGNGTFAIDAAAVPWRPNTIYSMKWGDANNDGNLDILQSGTSGSLSNRLYLFYNTPTHTFGDIELPVHPVGPALWGDYDGDGDLDILTKVDVPVTPSEARPQGIILRNDGNLNFVDSGIRFKTSSFFLGLNLDWGDCDNDGDLDVLFSGNTGGGYTDRKVYRNDGAGNFTDSGLPGIDVPDNPVWGDYDNDGDLDILSTNGRIYRNDGNGLFTDSNINLLSGLNLDSVAWGDYDNDGDLDFIVTGKDAGNNRITRVYRNNISTANAAPPAPTAPNAAVNSDRVTLSWSAPADDHTPSAGLSYNVYVTSSTGITTYALAPASALTNGFRRLPALGNVQYGNTAFLFIPAGAYQWGVQAIDGALRGGAWTTGSLSVDQILRAAKTVNDPRPAPGDIVTYTVTITNVGTGDATGVVVSDTLPAGMTLSGTVTVQGSPNPIVQTSGSLLRVSDLTVTAGGVVSVAIPVYITPGLWGQVITNTAAITNAKAPLPTNASVSLAVAAFSLIADQPANASRAAWGDYDNDGDLDLVTSGEGPTGTLVTRLYRNEQGQFVDSGIANLARVADGGLYWNDYNNDGWLDLLITGRDAAEDPVTELYRNQGDGSFVTADNFYMWPVADTTAAWGDYDDDGDQDLLIAGFRKYGYNIKLYRNQGATAGWELQDTDTAFPNTIVRVFAWVDYDNDGDLDIFLAGDGYITNPIKLYRNDGDGRFVESASFTQMDDVRAVWGDYDNDGDPDLLLNGNTPSGAVTKLYRNQGHETFVDAGLDLPTGSGGSVAWADYDNDGDLDIFISGYDPVAYTYITRLYRNDSGSFVESGINSLTGVLWNWTSWGTAEWGDMDNDGDLDLFLGRRRTDDIHGSWTWLYRNNAITSNAAPAAPPSLSQSVVNRTVALRWGNATDDHTPLAGLSYNLGIVGGNGVYGVSPLADDTTGYRRIPAPGNSRHTNGVTLTLSSGQYQWRMQAVDSALRGGAWTDGGAFTVVDADMQPAVSNAAPELGDVVTFTLTIRNKGTTALTGGFISDTLPAGLSLITGSVTLNPPGAGITGTPPALVSNLTVGAGASVIVTFRATAVAVQGAPQLLINTAVLTSTQGALLTSRSPLNLRYLLFAKPAAVGDCFSWATACDLQTALALADAGDEIWAAHGTYYPGAKGNQNASFVLKPGVGVYGGFYGWEIRREDALRQFQLSWPESMSILSGDIDQNDDMCFVYQSNICGEQWRRILGANSHNVVIVTLGVTKTAVLDGFMIAAGDGDRGAGILNTDGAPTLRNLTIMNNHAANKGGGMFNHLGAGNMTMENVYFGLNRATLGGGLYNETCWVTLINAAFDSNWATAYGGAIYNLSGQVSLEFATMEGNFTGKTIDVGNGHSGNMVYNDSYGTEASRTNVYNSILWDSTHYDPYVPPFLTPNYIPSVAPSSFRDWNLLRFPCVGKALECFEDRILKDDPQFKFPAVIDYWINLRPGDLNLKATSPALSKATFTGPAYDIQGLARTAPYNLGAYEDEWLTGIGAARDARTLLAATDIITTFNSTQGYVTLAAPSAAFSAATDIGFSLGMQDGVELPGWSTAWRTFRLMVMQQGQDLPSLALLEPVTLTLSYAWNELMVQNEAALTLRRYDPNTGAWSDAGITVVNRDLAQHTLTVLLTQLGGNYALLLEPSALYPVYTVESANGRANLAGGALLTYTAYLINPTGVATDNVRLTVTLPSGVTFGQWITTGVEMQDFASLRAGSVITGGPDYVAPHYSRVLRFTAQASSDAVYWGQTLVSTATFSADGGVSGGDTASFSLDGPPIAGDDYILTTPGTAVTFYPLSNDYDLGALSIGGYGTPAHGAVLQNGAALTYTPTVGFEGVEAFTYVVQDGVFSDTGLITITVRAASAYLAVRNTVAITTTGPTLQLDGVLPGNLVTYTLSLANLSPYVTATSAVLTDALPAGVQFSAWITQSGASQTSNTIAWGPTSLLTETGVMISFRAVVSGTPGATLTNTVTASAGNADPVSASASLIISGFMPTTDYTLTITTTGTGSGTVVKSPDAISYTAGSAVILTATANAGSTFAGWSGDATGSISPVTVTMTANRSVTATFNLIPIATYTLAITTTGTGSGTVVKSPDAISYTAGTVVSLTATANTGSTFTGWSGDATGSINPVTVTMTANRSVTATFTLGTRKYLFLPLVRRN